ncbi:hypothetical protein N0V88_005168 [Collariella sp. IMI 366227]|nr:hypothetical protein N0V88_005168 [Collariella sp. IMI 366227]
MADTPAERVLSVGGHDIGYPHGHLGNLTQDEENRLAAFKTYLEQQGLYRHEPEPSHDDQTLLRFLRARKWVVKDAYEQFKDTEEWRKRNQLEVLYDTIDIEAGIPIYLFQIRHLDSKTVSTYEKATESASVSLRMFWNLKAHMQAASTLATAHYPETLDRIFIIGAPYFFSTVWGWIKRWFDPITVSKIFILSASEVKSTLEEFIEPRNIPKLYGGELDFEFFARPNVDPKIKEAVRWENGYTEFPEGPAYWVPVEGGKRLACMAVGSLKDGKQRREVGLSISDNKVQKEMAEKVAEGGKEQNAAAVSA